MAEFSIIVPIYKVEPYLHQCIDSILAQTYPDFELILVDDGSPDNCGKICDEYAVQDSRIKVIHKVNGGVNRARKTGVQNATGKYVCWVDADDYIGINLLQTMHEIIETYAPDMVAFGFKEVRDDGTIIRFQMNNISTNRLYLTQENNFYDSLVYNCKENHFNQGVILPSLWSKVIKREKIVPCMLSVPDEVTMGEDVAATIASLCLCDNVYVSSICEYYYRFNVASISHTFKRDLLRRRQVLFQFMNTHMDKISQSNKDAYACQQIIEHITAAARDFDTYSDFKQYITAEMTPELKKIVDRCGIPKLPLKHKLLFVLLKHYCYWGFWMIYHVLKKH